MAPLDSPLVGLSVRQMPGNMQAEQALLGAIMRNNAAFDRCGDLRPEHFADRLHGAVFARIKARIESGRAVDMLLLRDDFAATGELEAAGGVGYLAELLTAMVGIINAGEYADAIRDAALRRHLIALGEVLVNDAFSDADRPGEQQASDALGQLLSLSADSPSGARTFAGAGEGIVARSEAAQKGTHGAARLDTGIASVDAIWRGLWPGDLYCVLAPPNTGKTPFLMQIARHVAQQFLAESEATGEPSRHVLIFSLEMSAENLFMGSVASCSRWCADDIREGNIGNASDWIEYQDAVDRLRRLPIIVDDGPKTLAQIAMRARVLKRQKKIAAIGVDYEQLVHRGRDEQRMSPQEWYPHIGYAMKNVANACGVPCVMLSQVNKPNGISGWTQRLQLSDKPYDGGQAYDGVFSLRRPELYMRENDRPPGDLSGERLAKAMDEQQREMERWRGITEFGSHKRRFGKQNTWVDLHFDGPRMTLSDRENCAPPPDLWGQG